VDQGDRAHGPVTAKVGGTEEQAKVDIDQGVRVSAFGKAAAWLPGLSNLVNTGNEEPWSSKRAVRRSSRELMR